MQLINIKLHLYNFKTGAIKSFRLLNEIDITNFVELKFLRFWIY